VGYKGELWSVLTEGVQSLLIRLSLYSKICQELTREELRRVGFNSHIDYFNYENQGLSGH
jgi:hypothetical protein